MIEPANFRAVDTDNKIYRGGQPMSQSEWEFIYSLGVRQVVKLNLESEAQDTPWQVREPADTNLVYCPITAWQQIVTEPELTALWQALDSLAKPVPTYVHCEHGINRTGLFIAVYRVVNQGWTPEAARQEWHGYGAVPIEQEGLEKAFEDMVC